MSSYYGTKQLSDYSEGEIYSFWTQMLVVKEADERVIQKYGYLLLDDFSTSKELNALGRHRLKGVIVGKHESRHEKENDYIIVMFKNNDKYCIVEYAVGLEEDALWNDGSEKIEGNWVGHITPGTWNKPIDKGGLKSAREIVGGIILRYTPYVNDDGYITAKVHTEISTPSYVEEMGAYKFSNRSADTVVRLKDGETMVIGGLIGKEETKSFSKVPFLSEIPILGKLFTYKNNSSTENEIVIFLTAKLV